MDIYTLAVKPYHMDQLREAVRARAMIVNTDTTSTATDKIICADLMERVNLLARAIETEHAAKIARREYNFHIYNTPEPHGRRARKNARILAMRQEMEQYQVEDTPTEERPSEQPQEPPQDLPEVPDVPDIPAQATPTNTADIQQRPF